MSDKRAFFKRIAVMWISAAMIINTLPLPAFADEADETQIPEVTEEYEPREETVTEEAAEEEYVEEESVAEEPVAKEAASEEVDGEESAGEVSGNGTADDPWVVSTWAELSEKMSAGGHIKLGTDVTDPEGTDSSYLDVPSGKVVTLDLNGKTIDRGLAGQSFIDNGYVITVSGDLTIGDSSTGGTGVITGGKNNNQSGFCGGCVYVDNGTFTMTGGTISDNNSVYNGNGVYVDVNGIFNMNGGTICNNGLNYYDGYGGGVYVAGTFNMGGGTITHCKASKGGGVYVTGTFNMTGGLISGNATKDGHESGGGGVYLVHSSFNMSGGTIFDNESYGGGGGVYLDHSPFNMTGGLISGNSTTITSQYTGGGVYSDGNGMFTVSGNPVIKGNKAGDGRDSDVGIDNYGSYRNIIITGKLGDDADIRVYSGEGKSIAEAGYNYTITDDDAAKFYSSDGRCVGELDEHNFVILSKLTTWAGLQELLNGASTSSGYPTKIKMNCDATAGENDVGLVVKERTFVELDLNGHTIDRGLAGKEPKDDGYVIWVSSNASLTILDCSVSQTGTITGGNNTDFGGGVCMDSSPGVFNLAGGTIKGNNARYGGGVYVWTGYCCISGKARIEGNSCFDGDGHEGFGGGVDVYYGNVSLQDNPVIRDNVRNGTWDSTQGVYTGTLKSNLYLGSGEGIVGGARKIEINSPLTSGASIGVILDTPRKFTDNWNSIMGSADPADFFTSDDPQCSVSLQDGEAALTSHTHSFTYTADGATITATCSNSDGNCPLEGHKASITIKAPNDLTYDGNEKPAEIYGDSDILGTPVIAYKRGDTPWGDAPKCAENAAYTASVTLEGVTASVSYTIEKKPVTITGLSAENKIYDGDTGAVVKGTPSVNGVIDADSGFVIVSPGRAAFTDPNAGTGKTVKFSGWSIDGESAFNYKLSSQPADVTADIEKAPQADIEVQGTARYGTEGTVELKDVIKAGGNPGTVSISSDEASVLDGIPVVTDETKLSFKFKDVSGNAGKKAVVTVSVNDADNYEDYRIVATLEVTSCLHEHKTLIEGTASPATCTQTGYTGDFRCSECHAVIKGDIIPVDPENHDLDMDNPVRTKEPTAVTKGENTYTCRRCGKKKVIADIPCVVEEGKDFSDLIEDTTDLSGNSTISADTVSNNKGELVTVISVNGTQIEKTVKDPESGKETVESAVWIAGLKETYTYTGSAIKPAIRIYDGTRKLVENTDYTLSHKNNKKVGKDAAVIIKFKGSYSATEQKKASFEIIKAELGKDIIAHDTATADEKKLNKAVPALTWAETGKAVSSKSFNFEYGEVSGNECTVTITPKSNYSGTYDKMTTAKVRITDNKNLLLSNARVTFDPKSYAYTGKVITPSYKVTMGTETLVKDTDFTETIKSGINPGTAVLLIEAKPGNAKGYAGTKTATFKIRGGRQIKDNADISIKISKSVPYAKGGAKAGVVIMDGDVTLKEGIDYTVSYSKNKAVTTGETAEAKIKGKGNYKGNVTEKFAITKQQLSMLEDNVIIADQFTTKDKLKKPSVTITDLDGKKLSGSKDFVIDKTDDTDPANTDESGTVKVTIKAKDGGAYEGTVDASFRYMKSSANIGKAKTAKKIADQTYTGYAVKLSNEDLKGVLKTESGILEPGKDFVIDARSYSKNNKKGTAKVTLVGIGSMAGRKTVSFKITARPVNYAGPIK